MELKIRKGNVVIELPLEKPRRSASGKTRVVASSYGVQRSTTRIGGKIVCAIANAFVYAESPKEKKEKSAVKRKANR
jgi:hypothetical protein